MLKNNQDKFRGSHEELEIIMKAVEKENISIWNDYVKSLEKKYRDGIINSIDISLSGINLSACNINGADLDGADLKYANMQDTYLCEGQLVTADLRGAILSNSNLSRSSLIKASNSHFG